MTSSRVERRNGVAKRKKFDRAVSDFVQFIVLFLQVDIIIRHVYFLVIDDNELQLSLRI